MTPTDVARVQAYLRHQFGTDAIEIIAPKRAGLSVEVAVRGDVIGTVHKDTEDGETSYALHLTILEEDLPAADALPASKAARGRS